MTRFVVGAAAFVAALGVTAACADEPFGTSAWLASPQLCQEAKTAGSLQKTLDDGNLVLSAKGLQGADFRCHFVQVLKAPEVEAWVATALCRQEGSGDFPNMYSISKGSDGRLTLVTVYDDEEPAAEPDGGDGGDGGEDAAPAAPPATAQSDAAPNGAPDASGDEDAAAGDVYSRCDGVSAP